MSAHPVTGRALFAIAAAAVALSGCDLDIGDQSCTESSIERDLDDECPYGPPGGPAVKITNADFCADPPQVDVNGAGCGTEYTWGRVFDIFVDKSLTTGGGNCMGTGCHGAVNVGDKPAFEPAMYATNSRETHTSLMRYGREKYQDRPYIQAVDAPPELAGPPENAWIMCNLQNMRGKVMPFPNGFKPPDNIEVVRGWVNCGMKYDELGGVGGGGVGGGGVGGVGGVGGAE